MNFDYLVKHVIISSLIPIKKIRTGRDLSIKSEFTRDYDPLFPFVGAGSKPAHLMGTKIFVPYISSSKRVVWADSHVCPCY